MSAVAATDSARKLKRFGNLSGGSGFPVDEQGYSRDEMEIPYFKVKDLGNADLLMETDSYVSRETADRLGAEIFPASTIVFAKVGAALLLNRFRILGVDGCIDNNMMALTLNATNDVGYFTHLLNATDISVNFNQGPVPSVNKRQVGDLRVCAPSATEQKRIAAYLDASCRVIDAAVAAKKEQIGVLVGAFKATLQRVVTCGLDNKGAFRETGNPWLRKVPRRWGLVMLKHFCDIQSGLTLGKEYEGSLVERPYLRVANVQDGHVLLDNLSTIEVPPEVAARTTLRTDDVLMTEGGDLDKLGRGVVWQGEVAGCLHQNHVFAIRCHDWKLRPQFLAYVSAAQHGRDYFEATGKKTTNLAATNSTKVGQFPIPLPSIDEQDRLIEYLDAESRKMSGLRSLLVQQIDTLIAYRKSLIHECVTGQRRITDEEVNRVTAHVATLA